MDEIINQLLPYATILTDYLAAVDEKLRALGIDPALQVSCAFILLLLFLYLTIRSARLARERSRDELSRLTDEVKSLRRELSKRKVRPFAADKPLTKEAAPKPEALAPEVPEPVVAEVQPPPPAPVTLELGLKKTRGSLLSRFKTIFSGEQLASAETIEKLEELLISSDLGTKTTTSLLEKLREHPESVDERSVRARLKEIILETLSAGVSEDPRINPVTADSKPFVVLFVGVNGVGKTTTIGKLAKQFNTEGKSVLLAACDTFRAAAPEQLRMWAERVGVGIELGEEGSKPSTVAYRAVHRALEEKTDVLIIDTAGRQHTKVNLMNELSNVIRIIDREYPGAPHETMLVLDASTGQNALQQAKQFHEVANLTGVVMTKLDGTPKGGILVAVKSEIGVPIRYIGIGEGIDDLRLFSAEEFVEALFEGEVEEESEPAEPEAGADKAPPRRVKRKRRESLAL